MFFSGNDEISSVFHYLNTLIHDSEFGLRQPLNLLMKLYSNLANFCCKTDSKWSTTGGVVVLWHWDYCNSYSLFSLDEVSRDPDILAVHFWNAHCHKTESIHLTKRATVNSLLHYGTTNMLLAYFGKCGIAFLTIQVIQVHTGGTRPTGMNLSD